MLDDDYCNNNLSLHIINNIRGDDDRLMEYVLKWTDDYYDNNASFESTTVVVIVIYICSVVCEIKSSTGNDSIE